VAVVERVRPDAPLRELRDLLEQLDRVRSPPPTDDVAAAVRHGAPARARADAVSFARPLLLLALACYRCGGGCAPSGSRACPAPG